MAPPYVIGIDGGTESIRAGVFDSNGKALAFASSPYPTQFPQPGWAEQDPEDWWRGLGEAVRQAVKKSEVPREEIKALGMDTTCCSVVALDKAGRPLRPCLLWMDMRSAECAKDVLATGDESLKVNSDGAGPVSAEWMVPKVSLISSGGVEGFQRSIAALRRGLPRDVPYRTNLICIVGIFVQALWIKRNEPELFAAAEYVCEYQDFMNFRLTGCMVASVNNASIRWHYSTVRGWPVSLLAKLHLSELKAKWPQKVVALGEVVGGLTASAAEHLGLAEGLPVAQGGADAFVGMVGLGVSRSGELALLTGSSHLHLGLTHDRGLHGRGMWGTYPDAVLPGLGVVEGGQTSTGSIVAWFRRLISGSEKEGAVPYATLNEEAEAVPIGCEGLICLDHFQGNRTPFTDPLSRGSMVGLTLKHGRGHIFRALIEAVCMGTEVVFEAMRNAGYSPSSIAVAGGATRSPLWLQTHADVSNVPLRLTRETEACVLGSAVLAAVGARIFPDIPSAIQEMVHVERTVLPDPDAHAKYREVLEGYRQVYPALRSLSHGDYRCRSDPRGGGDQPEVAGNETTSQSTVGDCVETGAEGVPQGEIILGTVNASILAADLGDLGAEVRRAVEAGADWIHVDVVDNHFAKVLTFGPPLLESLRRRQPRVFLDVHLAVEKPQEYVDALRAAGASQMLFHPEALRDHEDKDACSKLALQIEAAGMRAGVVLRPETPVSEIVPLLKPRQLVRCVNVLAVQPGFGGQSFDARVLRKVEELRSISPGLDIEVDGGVNATTASLCVEAGANVLTAGSFIFRPPEGDASGVEDPREKTPGMEQAIAKLREALGARWPMRFQR